MAFDPLTYAHLEYFIEAKKLGTHLLVILNTDKWLMEKKGYVFMPYDDRARIIAALRCVDCVAPQLDEDETVRHSLRIYNPNVFAKGGDRTIDNTPEVDICQELGIEVVFGVGGEKKRSSSNLVERAARALIEIWDEKEMYSKEYCKQIETILDGVKNVTKNGLFSGYGKKLASDFRDNPIYKKAE